MQDKTLDINRETAMQLWEKSYGKETRVNDFAGREMDKGAYDQRGSKYGWNLDHILPKSQGGKDTESNLICTHILTNDEKADKFPCFIANGKQFEIIKVQNHYEIREKTYENLDLRDAQAGISLYKTLDKLFWGTVTVRLSNVKSAAIIDFIKEIFDGEDVLAKFESGYNSTLVVRVGNVELPTKNATQELLEKCLTLNTYLSYFFTTKNIVSGHRIFCEAHTQHNEIMCLNSPNKYNSNKDMVINELIRINSSAQKKRSENDYIGHDALGYKVYEYDNIWSDLSDGLKKIK